MPTQSGNETRTEKLTRLRARLAIVRAEIDDAVQLGSSFSQGGVSGAPQPLAELLKLEQSIENQIRSLNRGTLGGFFTVRNLQS